MQDCYCGTLACCLSYLKLVDSLLIETSTTDGTSPLSCTYYKALVNGMYQRDVRVQARC